MLRDGYGSFADYLAFLDTHPDWPDRALLRLRAEKKLTGREPDSVLRDFFAEAPPETGLGTIMLARVLEPEAAEALIVDAWRSFALSAESFSAFMAEYSELLAPHHEARLDMLLWRTRFTDAERLFPYLDDAQVALATARIAQRRQTADRTALMNAVPAALKGDPGLAFERFLAAADRGKRSDAVKILLANTGSEEALGNPQAWASWRRSLARWLMREGEAQTAYRVASRHHLGDSHARTDLEWLSGYLALTYLDDHDLALRHFRSLRDTASTPISLGRAHYWYGRTLEQMGRTEEAQASYAEGGRYQTSFYGLLAAEKAGVDMDPALTGRSDADWRDAPWAEDDVIRAAILLSASGERSLAEEFFLDIAAEMEVDDLVALSDLLSDLRAAHVATLVGKAAAERGIVLPEIYFPLHPLSRREMRIDPALALAIARRESEFDPVVASGVGAQGLMQLMPATAQEVSGWLGLRYSRDRLTSDPDFNTALGVRYLEHLMDRLGATPAMIAAGYNAGPGRPLIWSGDFGDPRTGMVDVVDWIEHIPFRETRNYVMRVSESIPVYRARLAGRTSPIRFTSMLIGEKPLIRPSIRPDTLTVAGRSAPPIQILSSANVAAADVEAATERPRTVAAAAESEPVIAESDAVEADADAANAVESSGADADQQMPVIEARSAAAVALSIRPSARPDNAVPVKVSIDRAPDAPSAPAAVQGVSPLPRPGG